MAAIVEDQASFVQTIRFVRQLRRDPALRQQLQQTRSLFGVAAVARRAGFALTPRLLVKRQALTGERFVGGYRRRLWRELLLPVDMSLVRYLDVTWRSHWRKGATWQRLLWRVLFPLLVLLAVVRELAGQAF